LEEDVVVAEAGVAEGLGVVAEDGLEGGGFDEEDAGGPFWRALGFR